MAAKAQPIKWTAVEDQRMLLYILKHYEGKIPYDGIAAEMGCTANAVRKRIQKIRETSTQAPCVSTPDDDEEEDAAAVQPKKRKRATKTTATTKTKGNKAKTEKVKDEIKHEDIVDDGVYEYE